MLPRPHRLTARDIKLIMEKGRVAHSPLFTLRWISSEGQSRIAAIAPTKIVKTAVSRNRIRRKTYAALKPILSTIIPGIQMIFLAKSAVINAEVVTIEADIKELLKKSKLLVSL